MAVCSRFVSQGICDVLVALESREYLCQLTVVPPSLYDVIGICADAPFLVSFPHDAVFLHFTLLVTFYRTLKLGQTKD